jgi:energy-coupling factor transporter ATP-binding protein EcfA2
MLKLRRLRVEKFRNVVPGTEIRFSDGFNVLLGQNGTGKTTLLELISSIVRSNFIDLQGEEFSIEYEMAVGEIAVVVELRNRRYEGTPPLVLGETWRPSMQARIVNNGSTTVLHRENGHLHVNGDLVDAPELGPLLVPGVVNTTIALHGLGGLRDLVIPFLKSAETVRFDESLDVFRTVMTPARALAGMHLLRSPTNPTPFFLPGVWPSSPTIPHSLAVKLEPQYQADPTASRFMFSDQDLEFLGSAVRTMGFDVGQASIDVLARRSTNRQAMDYIEFGNLTFRFQFEDGGDMVSHDRLSYGQKRLLTFFCYLDMCPDVVIADELVNGLHHAWITAAIDAVGERQSFLTSQNPLLLDYLPITSPEQVRASFIFCRSDRGDRRPRWLWENMSENDAAEFFAAYDVGIEHVSEILQSRGLW